LLIIRVNTAVIFPTIIIAGKRMGKRNKTFLNISSQSKSPLPSNGSSVNFVVPDIQREGRRIL
jgi:hypothetical protein